MYIFFYLDITTIWLGTAWVYIYGRVTIKVRHATTPRPYELRLVPSQTTRVGIDGLHMGSKMYAKAPVIQKGKKSVFQTIFAVPMK